MTDNRSSSALFKRAEQLKRWEESDTNKQSPTPKRASRIQFSPGIVFLAACTSGDKDEVQRLLKMGADINTANVDGLTALHQACIDDNLDMVEFLVSHGADVNRGDNEGWTPLHATASCGFLSIARYLLENGGDVAAVNYDGELPVDIAESDAMEELLQKIIDEKGVDCDKSRNAEVDSLLKDAKNWAANGYVEVWDPKTGGTPLHVAAAKGYIDVAKTLLDDCNVDADCVDYDGWTPLHAAALWGQKEAAALLLKYGADPHVKNYSGQTCMDLVDSTISSWLADAMLHAPRRVNNNNNNNKRKLSPPRHDVKRVDIEISEKPEKVVNGDTTKPANNNVDDTILRRTHSFENDKTISPTERREREVNTWTAPSTTTANTNATNTTTQTTVRSSAESVESNSSNSTPSSATPTKLSPGNIFKNFFKSFVPPVRDEESETQRKAHAKRVRETRRSTQGVTLDEIKSAEQLVKKKTGNGTTESPAQTTVKKTEENSVPANTDNGAFELEDAGRATTNTSTTAPEATVTIPLRRPPAGSTANTTTSPSAREDSTTAVEEERERESSTESKSSSNASPASTQAALNVIQRRRRPKRRSTGVGHVDMEDIVNDRGGGGEGDGDTEPQVQSGTERTEERDERDYKALYLESLGEIRRLRGMLSTSEQQLRDARASITRLTQVNPNSLSEIEKREKRAMERKLSEMEEELKYQQALQAENQRLKDENGALIRVISKLSK